jgi:type I restriction enzyme M protein
MTYQELSNFIWTIADDVLRGLFKNHEYGDVIMPFLVLRRLDCVLEPHKEEVYQLYTKYKDQMSDPSPIIKGKVGTSFFNTSKYDLSRMKGDPKNIKLNFTNYLNGYSQNVLDIIENFQLDKPVEKLHKNNRLYLLIDKFTEVDLHPDKVSNRLMGQVYEELLRRFSEMSNETSGDHYTPRDVVRLLVALLFEEHREKLQGSGIVRSIFDCCAGSGGMLTIGKEYVLEHINPDINIRLLGQELNPQTYSICKSDFLITGEDPNALKLGSSLSEDQFQGMTFDYMATNPPFGVSWKSEKEFIDNEATNPNGRFSVGTPRTSDGSLLFLQHLISKMEDAGSRIGIVFNGSPLFTGDVGSGESEIRKWIIENDWLEAIVALPDQLFFNTGISTYVWLVTNQKAKRRRGKVQLINAGENYQPLKKSLGSKRKEISEEQRNQLVKMYTDFKPTSNCKIFNNAFFGYTRVTVEQPELDKKGKPVLGRDGMPKPDSSKRDTERIDLTEDIQTYFDREVAPHLPDAWMDRSKDKVGYEINFTKYFYEYKPLRSVQEISADLLRLEEESEGLLHKLIG